MRTDTGKATGDSLATLYWERNNETTHFVANNNNTGNVRVNVIMRCFRATNVQWKCNKYYIF